MLHLKLHSFPTKNTSLQITSFKINFIDFFVTFFSHKMLLTCASLTFFQWHCYPWACISPANKLRWWEESKGLTETAAMLVSSKAWLQKANKQEIPRRNSWFSVISAHCAHDEFTVQVIELSALCGSKTSLNQRQVFVCNTLHKYFSCKFT